jgi:hypothetical protein
MILKNHSLSFYCHTFLSSLAFQYETAQAILLEQKSQLASRVQLELISGGNIRFEEGTSDDIWSQ